jgi:hypothetical protein
MPGTPITQICCRPSQLDHARASDQIGYTRASLWTEFTLSNHTVRHWVTRDVAPGRIQLTVVNMHGFG